ncbi:unnamed protein product [Miscanthus lutarioriparius]|uniref:Uncharacterized protein n=1 Tax=Miscanthus lutarioriparius TaxID=422564 RepID=A0A811P0Q6_9POAL|nr:unnamed protein product [Miscanthus lutarioriparius]
MVTPPRHPLVGARAQPKLHAAPSSGTAHSLALPRQVAPTSEIRRGAPPPASLPPRSVAVGSSGCSGFSGVGVVGDADLSSSLVWTNVCSCIQHSSSPALASRIRGPGTRLQDPRRLRGGRRSSTLQSALGSRCQCSKMPSTCEINSKLSSVDYRVEQACICVDGMIAGQIIFKVQIILLLAENQLKEIELDDRNNEFIVFYRGKDFLSSELAEVLLLVARSIELQRHQVQMEDVKDQGDEELYAKLDAAYSSDEEDMEPLKTTGMEAMQWQIYV